MIATLMCSSIVKWKERGVLSAIHAVKAGLAVEDTENILLWVFSVSCEQNILCLSENSQMCVHVHGCVKEKTTRHFSHCN